MGYLYEACDEKCAYMFNVYKNQQQSQQTGSRNLMGPKTEKNATKNILDGRKDGRMDRGKTVYPYPPSGSGGIINTRNNIPTGFGCRPHNHPNNQAKVDTKQIINRQGLFLSLHSSYMEKTQHTGLQVTYRNNADIRQLLRRAAVLPLVPMDL